MTTSSLIHLLQHPQTVTLEQTSELENIIKQFPYFQSARAVYLKGLKNQESFKYNQELKTTAAYTTDRSVLFDYITSEEFVQNEISQQIKESTERLKEIEVKDVEDISVDRSVTIDDTLKKQVQDTEGVLDPALFERKIEIEKVADLSRDAGVFEVDTENIEEIPEKKLKIGAPLDFDKNETHSFTEWLKITSFQPIERKESKVKDTKTEKLKNKDKAKKFDLIDKFLADLPKIDPSKSSSSSKNIAKKQMIKPESLMTETLARIYVEQKNYEKAIQSYKILSLKYPEKSGFFADQIKAIKQLQEQNK
ncbi:MAG: hypothetical protein KJP09_06535 [Bacteroidia bacterium]|nr:hypothetical protein [Bacteroidia bacterium]NND09750.1 hypothetical protein [Flavobacteriaceae bacterium]NNK27467.1 hypothetical protein [Flavobacteriaceae bacterium]